MVAQADEVVVVAFAAIGGIAAARGLDDESQRVVALHAEGFGDGGEDARRVELAIELQAVGLEAVHVLDLERMHGIVETVADIGSVVVALAVVVDKTVFVAVEDGILLGFLQPVVVVGTVNLDVAHQVVEGGVDDMLFVRVVELGDVEEHRVDLRHVEIELVVAEFDVGGVDNETASIDASVEKKVAVLVHLELALPRIDDHLLAVAKHKLLDAMHPQGVAAEVYLGVGAASGTLENDGIIVLTQRLAVSQRIVDQLVLHIDLAVLLVERHQARACQVVHHQLGLGDVHMDILGELVDKEVVGHAPLFHVFIHPQDGVDLVDALNLAELGFAVVVAALEGGEGLVAALTEHRHIEYVVGLLPHNLLAVHIEVVVGVAVRAVVVAFAAVEQYHLLVHAVVSHHDAVVGDGVVGQVDLDTGVLADHLAGGDGELGALHRDEGAAVAMEDKCGGILGVGGDKLGTIHHEAAAVIHVGQDVRQAEVALVAAELGKTVFLGLHLGAQRLFDMTVDGRGEVVGVGEPHRVSREFGELGDGLVAVQLCPTHRGRKTGTIPVEAASPTLPLEVEVVIFACRAVDSAVVVAAAIVELHRLVESVDNVVAHQLEAIGSALLCLPCAGSALVEHTVVEEQARELNIVGEVFDFLVAALDELDTLQPLVEVVAVGGGTVVHQHRGGDEVIDIGQLSHLQLEHHVADFHIAVFCLEVPAVVNVGEAPYQRLVGSFLLLVAGGLVEVFQHLGREVLVAELGDVALLCP